MIRRFYAGIKGVIINKGKALILKRRNEVGALFWDLPGGRINDSEMIEEALLRELQEELPGIAKIKTGRLLHVWRLDRDLKDGIGLLLIYYLVNAHLSEVELSKEHIEYEWANKKDLRELAKGEIRVEDGLIQAVEKALS